MKKIIRCDWANKSELEQKYHDEEWGIPVHDDKKLFKMLILEGKQAGLSWTTILSKMDTLCEAFDDFDPNIIIKYDDKKVKKLLNEGLLERFDSGRRMRLTRKGIMLANNVFVEFI